MSFEEFTLKRRPVRDTPMISILKQGTIGINSVAYDQYFRKYKYVIFLFDRQNNKIGIKLTNDAGSNTYNIRVSRGGRLANISALAFLKYYEIPHVESKAYTCDLNAKENMVEVTLSNK
ncbi:MAG: hypothetical protein PHV55_07155 [Candidatus Omnitrophica bacterium]|nr:hypothetical protein [Candidatus Omnitrophota bacterium]